MKKEDLEFVFELVSRIAEAHKQYRNDNCSITLEHHGGKDYYTIDFVLKFCNSTYTDCVVFYTGDEFDSQEVLRDFDKIMKKADALKM